MASLCHRSTQSLILIIPCVFFFTRTFATSPMQLAWSSKVYGPDGPWHAVNVQVGTPRTSVDLYPASQYGSYIPNPNICDNASLQSGFDECPSRRAGIWDPGNSSTMSAGQISYTPDLLWTNPPLPRDGMRQIVQDDLYIIQPGGDSVQIVGAAIVTMWAANNTYPNGKKYPITVGTLCLGAPQVNWTFAEYKKNGAEIDGYENATILQSALRDQKVIPSSSYGMHIGSVAAGISPSLWLGGYDQSRTIGQVISQALPSNNVYSINLIDIGISTAQGVSPFDFMSKSGLLADGNSSIGTSGLTVAIEPGTPYMFLPKSTCDSIIRAASLPVEYHAGFGLYIWDTKNPRYHKIVSSSSFLSFDFRSPDGTVVSIKAPWKLFNLNLSSPLVDNELPYLPCSAYEGTKYTLGRAFLQAAFLGVNWRPTITPPYWFLAQAPGPNIPEQALVTTIADQDTSIIGLQEDWESSWEGYWSVETSVSAANNVPVSNGTQSGTNSRLSLGGDIGIGVCAGMAALIMIIGLFWFVIKGRRLRTRNGQRHMVTPPPASDMVYFNPNDTKPKITEADCRAQEYSLTKENLPYSSAQSYYFNASIYEADPSALPRGRPENPAEMYGQPLVLPQNTYQAKEWRLRDHRQTGSTSPMRFELA